MISELWRLSGFCIRKTFSNPTFMMRPAFRMSRMTAVGMDQLSYWAARTRKTRTMARAKTMIASDPTCFSWNDMPVHSKPMAVGSLVSASCSIRFSAWPEE